MDFDQKLSIAKTVIRWTVIGGSSKIVHGIVSNNTDPETISEKVQIAAGSFAIGGLIADKVSEHTELQIDVAVKHYFNLKAKYEEMKTKDSTVS